ncbi:MAG: urease accessory protein UreD [Gammaproteobacteria bacterium]
MIIPVPLTQSNCTKTSNQGWRARLELGFEKHAGRTVLSRRRHEGPLLVQKPFYPEQSVCHVYLLHPPGGVVGGDQLEVRIDVASGAHALITTPAAGKFYRSLGPLSVQRQTIKLDGGSAEWLPQESILFPGCRAELTTQVMLSGDARFIGWEVVCLGRPAAGEPFSGGLFRPCLELWSEGAPLLVERASLQGESAALSAPWGLAARPVWGTLVAFPATAEVLEVVRTSVRSAEPNLFSVTLLDKLLVCRFLGNTAEAARACFASTWGVIRPMLIGRPACPPRIWQT